MVIFQIFCIIIGLSFLVFIHELGHFFAAKLCKVKILTFSLGFGPDIIKHTYKGTKYCLKAVPFGGFVSMAGSNAHEFTGAENEYLSLKWYKKIWIAFAGPLSNYILAVIIFAFVFNTWGVLTVSKDSSIGSVIDNYPAAVAGIQSGDKIVSIDGVKVNTWVDLIDNVKNKTYKNASFIVERGTYSFKTNVCVSKSPVTKAGIIGIAPLIVEAKAGFFKSICLGTKTSIAQTKTTIVYLVKDILSLKKPDIAGPIGIVQIMADAAKSGIDDYLRLLGIISVALGLFNLFPIPMVDGGMIVLFFIEGIIGRQINVRVVDIYNIIGLIFIICIFIFATYNDLLRLIW
jgi:regulator of sigma E protease